MTLEQARAAAAVEVERLRAALRRVERARLDALRSFKAEARHLQERLGVAVVALHQADLALRAARGEPASPPPGEAKPPPRAA